MEHQGGLLTHYLIVTDRQLIFWMRGMFSEWFGAGPQADQLDISGLRGVTPVAMITRSNESAAKTALSN